MKIKLVALSCLSLFISCSNDESFDEENQINTNEPKLLSTNVSNSSSSGFGEPIKLTSAYTSGWRDNSKFV